MRIAKPQLGSPLKIALLIPPLTDYLGKIVNQLNNFCDGSIAASNSASTSPPSGIASVPYTQGDFIRNTAAAEMGDTGSKYVIIGWICVASGSPGTWLQSRTLTGN